MLCFSRSSKHTANGCPYLCCADDEITRSSDRIGESERGTKSSHFTLEKEEGALQRPRCAKTMLRWRGVRRTLEGYMNKCSYFSKHCATGCKRRKLVARWWWQCCRCPAKYLLQRSSRRMPPDYRQNGYCQHWWARAEGYRAWSGHPSRGFA